MWRYKNKRPIGLIANLRISFNQWTHSRKSMIIPLRWSREKKDIISFWELNGTYLIKIEFPSPEDGFVPSLVEWLKLTHWCWLRRFWNIVGIFSLYRYYLSLETGVAFHLNKLEFPWPKDALCQVWLKLAQWFWKRRWIHVCGKNNKQTDGRIDGQSDGRQAIRKAHLSFYLKWATKEAQNSCSSSAEFSKIPFKEDFFLCP